MPPKRLFRDAIHCFDSLIEISHNTEAIREFARKKDIDLKYLVDGANFLISKMHFNHENNYYVTLGLPKNSSADEIRERWKRLMLLYHPDRQEGQEEWVSERAKKVNEAYSTLKDEAKRLIYDKRLADEGVSTRPAPGPRVAVRKSPPPRRSHSTGPNWTKTRKYLPRLLVGLYVIVALIAIGIIYLRNRASDFEAELMAKAQQPVREAGSPAGSIERPAVPAVTSEEGKNADAAITAPAADSSVLVPAAPEQPEKKTAAAPSRPLPAGTRAEGKTPAAQQPARREPSVPAVPAQVKVHIPPKTAQEETIPEKRLIDQLKTPIPMRSSSLKQKAAGNNPAGAAMPVLPEAERNAVVSSPERGPETHESPQVMEKRAESASVAGDVPQQKAPPLPPVLPARAETLTQDEVEAFIQRYIGAYEKNDLESFMALFSRSAVENDRMDYNEIRTAYQETFSEKINYYKLSDLKVSLAGMNAFVSGKYSINRYLSQENRWVRHTGTIRWTLAKVNNALRITRINYDN